MNSKIRVRASARVSKSSRFEVFAFDQLAFEGGEEAFTKSVIVATRTHRGAHTSLFATRSKSNRGVLTALIEVMDHLFRGTLTEGHRESAEYKLRAQMIGHRPADPQKFLRMRRLKASSTTDKYRKPAEVGT